MSRSACTRLVAPRLRRGALGIVTPVFRAYGSPVDTTIKVDRQVRDRLATIARERGTTIRDLVSEMTAATPTREELTARAPTGLMRGALPPRARRAGASCAASDGTSGASTTLSRFGNLPPHHQSAANTVALEALPHASASRPPQPDRPIGRFPCATMVPTIIQCMIALRCRYADGHRSKSSG